MLAGCGSGHDRERAGEKLFFASGCLICHTYGGQGTRNLGAPDLTNESSKDRGIRWQVRHLRCPSCLVQYSPMPPYRSLSDEMLTDIAYFLEAAG